MNSDKVYEQFFTSSSSSGVSMGAYQQVVQTTTVMSTVGRSLTLALGWKYMHNQNFRLGFPDIAVSNEMWAIGPNFMSSNSYSIFNVDMINVLRFGYHHSSSQDI